MPSKTNIHKDKSAVQRPNYVLRLDVAMHDSLLPERIESTTYLLPETPQRRLIETGRYRTTQIPAFVQFIRNNATL